MKKLMSKNLKYLGFNVSSEKPKSPGKYSVRLAVFILFVVLVVNQLLIHQPTCT